MDELEHRLSAFKEEKKIRAKGQLSVMLHITRLASEKGLPLNADELRTPKEGQVSGLSKKRVQTILKDYGITHVLAEEGGRTSRGSLGNASDYVQFLNTLYNENKINITQIEQWWIEQVKEYLRGKPFKVRFDPSKSLHSIVSELLDQAIKRQKENPGVTYAGTVLQHLVGAKLDLILPESRRIDHYGANVADSPTARPGDFSIDNVAIHVTTSPSESLIRKCKENIDNGLKPVVITISASRAGVESIAKGWNIDGRIEVLEAEQFIATNILEWSKFSSQSQREQLNKLIERYNEIVAECETDPSLKIQV